MKPVISFIIIAFLIRISIATGQDVAYVRKTIDTLTSRVMAGRGYEADGNKLAAGFISKEFRKDGLKKFSKKYLQPFSIPINTFPDTIKISIDGKRLDPGKDFVVFSSSPSVSGTFDLVWALIDTSGQPVLQEGYSMDELGDKVVVTDAGQQDFRNENKFHSKGIIFLQDNHVWWHLSDGTHVLDYFQLQIAKDKIPVGSKKITIHLKNLYFEAFPTQNVIGFIKGKEFPDSFFVFSAHYDHLGKMGAVTYFPGANDNASGTAMLLDLAKHYKKRKNKPPFSLVFMAFSAEEVGLLGSQFYSQNPLFPLSAIKFLVNLDMVGSGSEGIKVVNGTIFKDKFDCLVALNSKNGYLESVSARGEAANSDHFPFYKNGVPCFFIYTLGKESKEYHNIYDTPDNAPLTKYTELFRLLAGFVTDCN